jgi:hypothetical protein
MHEIRNDKGSWQRRAAGHRRTVASSAPQRRNGSFGSAQSNYERYLELARSAALAGDIVEMENCYQHAEHYFRVMRAAIHE